MMSSSRLQPVFDVFFVVVTTDNSFNEFVATPLYILRHSLYFEILCKNLREDCHEREAAAPAEGTCSMDLFLAYEDNPSKEHGLYYFNKLSIMFDVISSSPASSRRAARRKTTRRSSTPNSLQLTDCDRFHSSGTADAPQNSSSATTGAPEKPVPTAAMTRAAVTSAVSDALSLYTGRGSDNTQHGRAGTRRRSPTSLTTASRGTTTRAVAAASNTSCSVRTARVGRRSRSLVSFGHLSVGRDRRGERLVKDAGCLRYVAGDWGDPLADVADDRLHRDRDAGVSLLVKDHRDA